MSKNITKFNASRYARPRIEEVEVDSETASMVIIKGRRSKKIAERESYHDTWEEAHAWLLQLAEGRLTSARRALENAQGFHGNVKGMKKPT